MAAGVAYAVVASTSPLTLYFDGDSSTQVPAKPSSSGYTPAVGDRVIVQLNTPRPPVILSRAY